MARIRSVKPEFSQSEAIVALPRDVRLHFIQLWTYADDYGRGKDEPRIIKGAIWPLDDDVTAEMVEEWQCALATAGRIVRYEVGGRRFFEVVNWMEHQKPNRRAESKIPTPDQGVPVEAVREQCVSSAPALSTHREFSAVVVGGGVDVEVGVEGAVTDGPSLAVVPASPSPAAPVHRYPLAFDAFWEAYPRKVGKQAAAKAFDKVTRNDGAKQARVIEACRAHATVWQAWPESEHQFIPHPATWLNEGRYDDPPPPPKGLAQRKPQGRAERNQSNIAKGYAQLTGGTT